MLDADGCKMQNAGGTIRSATDLENTVQTSNSKGIKSKYFDQPTAISDHFTLPAHSMNDLELLPRRRRTEMEWHEQTQ